MGVVVSVVIRVAVGVLLSGVFGLVGGDFLIGLHEHMRHGVVSRQFDVVVVAVTVLVSSVSMLLVGVSRVMLMCVVVTWNKWIK
jgi:hypothetical protein